MTKDPVCFCDVDEAVAVEKGLVSKADGQTQYFCSEDCKRKFDEDPHHYLMRMSDFDYPEDAEYDRPIDIE